MKNYMLMLSLTLVVAVTNVTWASVQFYEDEQLWSNAVANVEVFEITASNVSLANQVQTLPQYNTNVGVLLTFDRANTGLSRSFELEALQQDGLTGEGFVFYPEGTEAPGHDASLAVGDGHPLPSKHDNDDWSMTIIDGRPLYGFSFDLLENDLFNNEDDDILRVYDTEGTLIFTRPSIPEGPGTLFIGVVSDVPIGKIEFDEGDDLDNIAIANFCFGSIRPQVTILLDEEGQLNGQVINSENNAIQVLTGQEISGTINCIVDSNYAPSAQVPVAGTVTWGDRAEQPWMIQAHVTPGLNDLSVEIDLAVPSTPGWYNIIIASAGEFTEDQIMSATNWSLGAVTWNDDNDLGWDWNEDQYDEAKLYGFVENLHQSTDGYNPYLYGANWISVEVVDPFVLLTPSEDDALLAETEYMITWTSHQIAEISDVLLEYSADDGLSWKRIAITDNDGSFNWTVPTLTSTKCMVRISDSSNSEFIGNMPGTFSIYECRKQYQFVDKWDNEGELGSILGLAVSPLGYIYYGDTDNNKIVACTLTGEKIVEWGEMGSGDGQLNGSPQIAVDSSGQVYVADHYNNRIQIFSPLGEFVDKWEVFGDGETFYQPTGIAIDSSGTVFVADYTEQIYKFTTDGELLSKWGSFGSADGQLDSPQGLAVDDMGHVYVVDHYNHRIQKFTYDGIWVSTWGEQGSEEGQYEYPTDVAVDKYGYVYVSDHRNYRVQVFTQNGMFLTEWGIQGSDDGQFDDTWGIDVDSEGNVYVADRDNHRIQVFAPFNTLLADINHDCSVDLFDFSILASEWLSCTNPIELSCD